MAKQMAHGAIWLLDSAISMAMITAILLLFCFGVYAIWDTGAVTAAASPAQYEIYKPSSEEGQKTFQELQAINSDVLGWLTVYGTNIDYPLVQAGDNDTYLTTSAAGEYSLSGAIFLDYRNDGAFGDFNTIIYGHHMDQDAMFGDVSDFKEKKFFEAHEYGNLYYGGRDHGIEFFAFIETDAYSSALYATGLTGAKEREQYLAQIAKDAMYTRDIGAAPGERIILLSTCTTALTNGRHLLVGRITDELYEDAFAAKAEQKPVQRVQGARENSARRIGDVVPLWLLITTAAALTILAMIYKLRHFRGKHAKEDERQRRYKR